MAPARSTGTGATIHEHRDRHGCGAGFANDIEAFLHSATASDDIFGNQDRFSRCQREAAAEDEYVVFLFSKNIASLRLACDFLAYHQAAHGGSEHSGERVALQLDEEKLGESLDRIEVLAHLSALKIMSAVQTRAENEVPLLKGPGANEDVENFALNRIHGD